MKKLLTLFLALILLMATFILGAPAANAVWIGDFQVKAVDGYAEIIGCSPDISGDIVIPDFYGGYCITNIGIEAFKDATGITSVTIGEFVSVISYGAFKGCTSLETVNFKSTNCGASGSAERPVFEGCTALKTVNVSDGVKKIPKFMFYGVASLESVNLPADMPKIGEKAFEGCPNINLDEESSSSSKPAVSKPISPKPSSKPVAPSSKVELSSKEDVANSDISSITEESSSKPTNNIISLPTTGGNDNDDGGNNTLIFVWVGAGAALIVLAAVTIILLKK